MWGNIIISILSVSSVLWSPPTETIKFDIQHNGSSIGEFLAYKTVEDGTTTYINKTEVKAKIIGVLKVTLHTTATYRNNELEQSKVDITVNGNAYAQTLTKRSGDKYFFYKDGKLKTTINGTIRYSAAMMIFGEPAGFNTAYSEESGSFQTIEKSVPNVYEKRNSRGRKSIYTYKNQVLESMDVDVGLTKIAMLLKG